jgi:uncharacterized protein
MIKFLFLSFISFIALSFINDKKVHEIDTNSLLWKVEHPKNKKISYLFGTMHLIQKEFYYFPSTLEKIVKKSEVLLTEINLNELTNQSKAMSYLMLDEGSFFDFFTKEQKDSIIDWSKNKLRLDEATFTATFGKFKPFVLVQTITQMAFFGKTESYELNLKELGTKYKLSFDGLESVQEQLSFFDKMSKAEQAEMVMESIRDEENSIKELIQLQKYYRKQQLDSLLYLIENEKGTINKHEQTLLINRNKNWISKIEDLTSKSSVFIAVGAAHLIGKHGLIELLKQKGYILTPVKI